MAKKRKRTLGNPAVVMAAMQMAQRRRESQAERGNSNPVKWVVVGGLTLLAGGGLFLLGQHIVRNLNQDRAFQRTDDPNGPENTALRLFQAFHPDTPFGIGTDEELVRKTIQSIPHRDFLKDVERAYRKLTKGKGMMEEMEGELSIQMKHEIDMILRMLPDNKREAASRDPSKPTAAQFDAWAERIKAAADYEASFAWPYGTDEEAIYAVLRELPSARAACELDKTYRRKYGMGLLFQLTDEMEGEDLHKAYRILKDKPDAQGKTILQLLEACRQG
jgi:hypothetical protein